jgi:hypothetical protein
MPSYVLASLADHSLCDREHYRGVCGHWPVHCERQQSPAVCEFVHGAAKGCFLKRGFVKGLRNGRYVREKSFISRIAFKTAQRVSSNAHKFA